MSSSKYTGPARAGILGIERNIQAKQQKTSQSITAAFEDLKSLISFAGNMVMISRNIVSKIREHSGSISSDECVQLRSHLLSLGIDDPVTKETIGSTTEYHRGLAQEISKALENDIKEAGGAMLLYEAYCRLNRARGMQLVSPEDMLNACQIMHKLNLPLILHTFESGVNVLQLLKLNEDNVMHKIFKVVKENKSTGVSPLELAEFMGIPLLLAQERLLEAEKLALIVRDESKEGTRFFINLFMPSKLYN